MISSEETVCNQRFAPGLKYDSPMDEMELAYALFGLFIGAMIWIPHLMIDRWNRAEINRLRERIDSLHDRMSRR